MDCPIGHTKEIYKMINRNSNNRDWTKIEGKEFLLMFSDGDFIRARVVNCDPNVGITFVATEDKAADFGYIEKDEELGCLNGILSPNGIGHKFRTQFNMWITAIDCGLMHAGSMIRIGYSGFGKRNDCVIIGSMAKCAFK